MVRRIKVTQEDFSLATSIDGWVDGLIQGRRGLWVYVELGSEEEYIPKPNDNPKTEYRLFRFCDVYFAKTKESLEAGEFESDERGVTVIIYW